MFMCYPFEDSDVGQIMYYTWINMQQWGILGSSIFIPRVFLVIYNQGLAVKVEFHDLRFGSEVARQR